MRFGALFVVFCMLLIAASTGVTIYLGFGFTTAEAAIVALAVLTALGLYNTVSTRLGVRAVVGSQLTDMSRGNADMARQLAELGRRLAAVEGKIESTVDRARAATDPLAIELGELSTLVKQLAETVAAHEANLGEVRQPSPDIAPVSPVPDRLPADAEGVLSPAAFAAETSFETKAPGISPNEETLAIVRSAVDANRVDLYLQPIVTLPQRKVRFYEAMTRLRNDRGEVLPPANFIAQAEAGGLMPKIDNLIVFRCVQVVRRLLLKNRDIGLFCNVSGSTLTDGPVFQQLLDFLDANRAIAPSLILEFTQSALRAAGPIENESLSALADRGYRFSLDNLQDLRVEPKELAARGFRFVKVPGSLLLNRSGVPTDIHPADLSDLLGRFGIDLIAEKIESEGMVVDLLDYDVRFGQGFLFSPPRPVRAEALQGVADRNDVVARDGATGAAPAATARSSDDELTATDTGGRQRASGIVQLARRI